MRQATRLLLVVAQPPERVTYRRLTVMAGPRAGHLFQQVPLRMARSGPGDDLSGEESPFPPPSIGVSRPGFFLNFQPLPPDSRVGVEFGGRAFEYDMAVPHHV